MDYDPKQDHRLLEIVEAAEMLNHTAHRAGRALRNRGIKMAYPPSLGTTILSLTRDLRTTVSTAPWLDEFTALWLSCRCWELTYCISDVCDSIAAANGLGFDGIDMFTMAPCPADVGLHDHQARHFEELTKLFGFLPFGLGGPRWAAKTANHLLSVSYVGVSSLYDRISVVLDVFVFPEKPRPRTSHHRVTRRINKAHGAVPEIIDCPEWKDVLKSGAEIEQLGKVRNALAHRTIIAHRTEFLPRELLGEAESVVVKDSFDQLVQNVARHCEAALEHCHTVNRFMRHLVDLGWHAKRATSSPSRSTT